MRHTTVTSAVVLGAGTLLVLAAFRQNGLHSGPQSDSSFVDSDGTAHVTRVVPVPTTVSPEAQKMLARQVSDAGPSQSLAERRAKTDAWQRRVGAEARSMYPVKVEKRPSQECPLESWRPPPSRKTDVSAF
jgi:hypothetical protein